MAPIERRTSPEPVRDRERSVELRLGGLGGIELRSTRMFLWRGPEREGAERVLPFSDRPVGTEYERSETTTRAGGLEVRTVGNPLVTVALAGTIALRRWLNPDGDEPRAPT